MAHGSFVAYYRVSTVQQGKSGLGIEAQKRAVQDYLNGGEWVLRGEFTEQESGKNNDRPTLAQAMELCRLTGSTLVIAKLDRLSRDAHFLLGLQKAGTPFVAADMPHANALTVGIMALVAEEERKAISKRTTEALASAKIRRANEGKPTLGGWRGGPKVDSAMGRAAIAKATAAFVGGVAPMITDMRASGLSLRTIAANLTTQGVKTPHGGTWTATAVSRVLART